MADEFESLSIDELEELLNQETEELRQATENKDRVKQEKWAEEHAAAVARVRSENTSVSGRTLVVCMFVDAACEMFGRSTASEFECIEETLSETLGNPLVFHRDIPPYKLEGRRCDIYVIDIGGLGTISGGEMDSHYRNLYRTIADRPSTAFILWSEFTKHYYRKNMTDEIVASVVGGDSPHNILMYDAPDWAEKCLMIVG